MLFLKALLIYACLCAAVFLVQRQMLFHPDQNIVDLSAAGAQPLDVVTADGVALRGWFVPPAAPDAAVAVLFHGNAGQAAGRAFKVAPFIESGMGFLLAEYRGYGGNAGKPSAAGFYHDARAYLDALSGRRIVLYGESVGTGVASKMAHERAADVEAVILETPYTSMPALAQGLYPFLPAWPLVRDRFSNAAYIADINVPVLILHGRMDEVVPYRHAERLMERAGDNVRLVTFDQGRHNDLHVHGAAQNIAAFLNEITARHDGAPDTE